jgi:uracil-DNA glycosylase
MTGLITTNPFAAPDFLAQLQAATDQCRDCPIGLNGTRAVAGDGSVSARLVLVGEQPGDVEEQQGRPFVGPAGKLLGKALDTLGWDRHALYLTNAVKHFKYEPRGKRRLHKTPTQREADACLQWLDAELAHVQPRAAIALGATAGRSLLGRAVPIMRERGLWQKRADGLPVLVTLHPSALLRAPPENFAEAFEAWLRDLREADRFAHPDAK